MSGCLRVHRGNMRHKPNLETSAFHRDLGGPESKYPCYWIRVTGCARGTLPSLPYPSSEETGYGHPTYVDKISDKDHPHIALTFPQLNRSSNPNSRCGAPERKVLRSITPKTKVIVPTGGCRQHHPSRGIEKIQESRLSGSAHAWCHTGANRQEERWQPQSIY